MSLKHCHQEWIWCKTVPFWLLDVRFNQKVAAWDFCSWLWTACSWELSVWICTIAQSWIYAVAQPWICAATWKRICSFGHQSAEQHGHTTVQKGEDPAIELPSLVLKQPRRQGSPQLFSFPSVGNPPLHPCDILTSDFMWFILHKNINHYMKNLIETLI